MTWKPGDAPEGHPLWAQQIELEFSMAQRGQERYHKRLSTARDKEDLSRMRPFRQATEALTIDTIKGLRAWLNGTAKSKAGTRPLAYDYLKLLNPDSVGYITVRVVLDRYGGNHFPGFVALAQDLGLEIEYQARMEAWCKTKEGRALYADVQRGLRKQRATETHKRRVNINRFNALVAKDISWQTWSRDVRFRVGGKMLEVLCGATGRFEMVEDPLFVRTGKKQARYVLQADKELEQWLMESLEEDATRTPVYLPTVVPPKPWNGVRDGGYYTKVIKRLPLIRFKAHAEESQGIAMDEFDALDMPRVYSAIEAVQNVPWRVNKRVLQVAWDAYGRGMKIKGLARTEPDPIPPAPPGLAALRLKHKGMKGIGALEKEWIEANGEEWHEWKKGAAKVYGENARRISKSMSARTTLFLAEEFKDKEFYFPHRLDFRGRMYPIPVYLQPQGNDLSRGLLTFAHGRPIGTVGGYWLAIHVANCWGYDKVGFDARVDWTVSKIDLIKAIAENPLGVLEWTQSKKPWQTLAAIMEFARCYDGPDGDAAVTSLPIHVDGTCNGIQHLSAMMRDEEGGRSVNLLPSEEPRDIYGEVAETLQETLEGIESSGGDGGRKAALVLDSLDRDIPRDFTKRQVMILPYGGTREAYFRYTHAWYKEREEEEGTVRMEQEDKRECVPFVITHLWDAVSGRVGQAMVCMEWLKAVAKLLVETNQPIVWQTPTGFYVRHFYGKLRERRIDMLVNGVRYQMVDYERTKKLSAAEQLRGISPNFVHSQDASAMQETAIRFGVLTHNAPFTSVHDSFGTVAGEMWNLYNCIREAFVWVHSHDVMEDFRVRAVSTLRDHYMAGGMDIEQAWEKAEDIIPRVPQRGDLNIGEVLGSDYFFA